ncbi:putative hydro-lyase (plasmid) [Rhizobium sp. CB3090]|uniref:putative hydro-lyase n=1 Tax=Rhizobium sp. CB3090 TaxID=3039156 RepID=UPI0024B148D7|nr:putative hydro-lyase [Rhizobium sp. CB3090]WFU12198.1 putative hydro-lyase [Rhizobium sp. CB3090]
MTARPHFAFNVLLTPQAVRSACRSGSWSKETSGMAPGYVQANLVILPSALADDFLRFCVRNQKSCPLVGVSDKGSPHLPDLGIDLDIRTDAPQYRIWEDGKLVAEPNDISAWWNDDLVTFAIGCSFSFEEALVAEGIALRHVNEQRNVAMYRTNIMCTPVGPFSGPMIVSMRPLKPADAIRAVQITSRMPAVHGAPIHIGLPSAIGIGDIEQPDYGDPVKVMPDELPVFWACGVTPQSVIQTARPNFAITHAPGCMLVTDKSNSELTAF